MYLQPRDRPAWQGSAGPGGAWPGTKLSRRADFNRSRRALQAMARSLDSALSALGRA